MSREGWAWQPLRMFNDRASRPPGTWRKVLAVVLAVALPLAVWDKRGAVVGLVAFVVYGGVFLVATFDHRGTVAWSRRHPVLDGLIIVPLTSLALAYLTDLSVSACLAVAVGAGAMLVPVGLWRRRRHAARG